ncbi:MAG: amidase [Beijerinckiaceae bacterium]|nr:amidase [Beijerinckiaceae bacterium]
MPESFAAATAAFQSGKDSPRDFLERRLAAIEAREGEVLAFTARSDVAQARILADEASARWRDGAPLSPVDGMPFGVKDVIETIHLPTQMGSPLYAGWRGDKDSASVKALREAGAIVVGKTVTTEFAASHPGPTRNPHDLTRTPGGSSSGSAAGVAADFFTMGLGTQVVGSIVRPASFCGVVGFKPTFGGLNRGGSHDYMSQSAQGVLAATLDDTWLSAYAIVSRVGGDPGFQGLIGPATVPAASAPASLVFLETPGWTKASESARDALLFAVETLKKGGVKILTRRDRPEIEEVEQAIHRALPLTRDINAWESRWPLNTYMERDASKLSEPMRARFHETERMTVEDYRLMLAERLRIRAAFANLASIAPACITLSATGPAPVGLSSTGDPAFVVPGSMLGVPALNLPLLRVDDLPVGIQMIGYEHGDADLFARAAWVTSRLS